MGLKVPPRWARPAVMRWLVRLYRGHGAVVLKRRLMLLTTVGHRTGLPRTCPVMWFPDGPEAWVVGAGNYGEDRQPSWYRNLVAHPDQAWIEIGGRKLQVAHEELQGDGRQERLRRFPMLSEYQQATAREVPILRLTPLPMSGTASDR